MNPSQTMEISSFYTSSKLCWLPSSVTDMVLLKKAGVSQCYQSSVFMFSNKRRSQQSLNRSVVLRHNKYPVQMLCSQKKEILIVEARSMDDIYDTLAERLVPTAASGTNTSKIHIVGLAGPPGAGKTTIASEVAKRVNKLWPQKATSFDSQVEPTEIAAVLPMDGFHLYRHQLDSMEFFENSVKSVGLVPTIDGESSIMSRGPRWKQLFYSYRIENPKEAHARRGAPWTFDPDLFLKCLKTLREQGSVCAPSFDHGVGDPIEDDIHVNVHHKVVIVEGNYLLLDDGGWKEILSVLDEKWFVDVDIDIAMERVLKRHISTGNTPEIAKQRIEYNDRPNAELVYKSKKNADLIIKSVAL